IRSTIFRSGLVSLDEFRVKVSHIQNTQGDRFNYDLHIEGHMKSDTAFKKCFIVLEMIAWKINGFAFAQLPDLPAGETIALNVTLPLAEHIEEGHCRVHLFSDGIELLHTRFPADYVAQQQKKTTDLLTGK